MGFGRKEETGHAAPLVEPAGRLFHVLGGHRLDPLGPLRDILKPEAGRQRRAVPAGERRLIVLRIDRFGDEPGFGALEIRLIDGPGRRRAMTASIAASSRSSETPGAGTAKT